MQSESQSGAFRLPNGNTLVTVVSESYIFEITHYKEVVWEYYSENGIIPRDKKYGIEYFFISGDMNNDGELNIIDIIYLINHILNS